MVFSDRFNYTEMQDILSRMNGLSRQVVYHDSGLSERFHTTALSIIYNFTLEVLLVWFTKFIMQVVELDHGP